MMLPILISVSLAPGSYFFCADAVVAITAATADNIAAATRFCIRTGIVPSQMVFIFVAVSQAAPAHASTGLFRGTKRHCCAPPFMIDAWEQKILLQGPAH